MEIPGYRIERLIAEGGMSSVYLAVQESLGRRVALKILKKFDSPQHAERFLHEARIIASLENRNTITIHDVGTVSDRHYIAMEYLEGGSLADRIDRGMPPSAALDLLESIASCLDFVHRKDIVHRDIKPSNILFHADGTPKLTDFGIAKQLDADQELTMDGTAFGSPHYLSPEQAECRPLDGRSDVYALGIVFYQMLTGRRPYAENSHVETIVAHLSQPIPLLPGELACHQGLLEKMIAKRPEDRVASANDLLRLIRESRSRQADLYLGHGGGHAALPDGAAGRGKDSRGRMDRMSSPFKATAALLLVLATGIYWLSGEPEPKPDNVTRLEPRPAKPVVQDVVVAAFEQQLAVVDKETESPEQDVPGNVIEEEADVEPLTVTPPPAPSDEVNVASEHPVQVEEVAALTALPTEPVLGPGPESPMVDNPTPTPEGFDERIEQWMSDGDGALKANRLTRPKSDNAYAYYLKVVGLDPSHAGARAGINKIADRYAALARGALAKGAYSNARLYVQRGLAVRPGHADLAAIRGDLEERQRVAELARANEAADAAQQAGPRPRMALREFEGTSVVSQGPEGTGNIVKDFKHVWRSVFD